MKVRTVPQAVEEMREKDPSTALGYKAICRMIREGVIKGIKVGNRVLVDMDTIEKLFDVPGVYTKVGHQLSIDK